MPSRAQPVTDRQEAQGPVTHVGAKAGSALVRARDGPSSGCYSQRNRKFCSRPTEPGLRGPGGPTVEPVPTPAGLPPRAHVSDTELRDDFPGSHGARLTCVCVSSFVLLDKSDLVVTWSRVVYVALGALEIHLE